MFFFSLEKLLWVCCSLEICVLCFVFCRLCFIFYFCALFLLLIINLCGVCCVRCVYVCVVIWTLVRFVCFERVALHCLEYSVNGMRWVYFVTCLVSLCVACIHIFRQWPSRDGVGCRFVCFGLCDGIGLVLPGLARVGSV